MKYLLLILLTVLLIHPLKAQTSPPPQNCITIIGDSLPDGTFVANLPGTGVTVLQGERMAYLLDDALHENDLLQYGIYDLSLPASSLTVPDGNPYLQSDEATLASQLNCRFIVIFPFLNDLYIADDTADGIALYGDRLTDLVTNLLANSPDGQIVILDFYITALQGAGNMTYGDNVSALHVVLMNETHSLLCENADRISCLDLNTLLLPITDYTLTTISQTEYDAAGYTLLNPDDQTMIDAFWQARPNDPILGDGLHLNPAGQTRIIDALISRFTELDPINFAPIRP